MAASNRTFSRQRPAFSYLKHRHRLRESASALLLAELLLAYGSAARADDSWTGAFNTDWFNAANWQSGAVPTTGEVTISGTTDPTTPVIKGKDATATMLVVGGGTALSMNSGGLIIKDGGSLNNTGGSATSIYIVGNNPTVTVTSEMPQGSGVAIHSDSMLIGATDASRQGNGNLSVLNGASVGVGSLTIGSNTSAPSRIKIEGPGSQLSVDHALNLGGSAAHPSSSSTTSVIDIGKGGSLSNAVPPTSSLRPVTSLHDAVLTVAGENSVATLTSSGVIGTHPRSGFNVRDGGQVGIYTPSRIKVPMLSFGGTIRIDGATSVFSAGYGDLDATLGSHLYVPGTVTASNGGTFQAESLLVGDGAPGTGTLNIGSAPGDAAVAPGNVKTPRGLKISNTGTVNFNHTASNFVPKSALNNAGATSTGAVNQISGTTILTLDGNFNGSVTITGGVLQFGNDTAAGSLAADTIVTGTDATHKGTLAFGRSGTYTYDKSITGTGSVAAVGSGTTILTARNSYSGGTTLTRGTLSVSQDESLGDAAGSLTFNGGNLQVTGKTMTSTARAITMDAAGGLDIADAANTLTVTQPLLGNGRLNKSGKGALVLTGDSRGFTGGATVADGTLLVQGALGGAVAVASGASIGGDGLLGGSLTLDAGGATLIGRSGHHLTIGQDLTLAAGNQINVKLGAPSTHALFSVKGNLTLAGTLNVSDMGGFGPGLYRLFNYDGTLVNHVLTLGKVPGGSAAVPGMSIQTAVNNQVNLVNNAGMAVGFWDGGDPAHANNHAIDGGAGLWNLSNDNWTDSDGALNAPWRDGTFAIFAGQAGTVTAQSTAGAIAAGGMQFATDGYLIKGDAIALATANGAAPIIRVDRGVTATVASELRGTQGLHKTDFGALVLTGNNSYTGATTVSDGVLQLGDGGTSGSIKGDVIVDSHVYGQGTLAIDRSNELVLPGAISGGGRVVQNGEGATVFAGNNTFSGGLTVEKGTARAGIANSAFGSGLLRVQAGATADLAGFNTTVGGLAGAGDVKLGQGTLTLEQNIGSLYSGVMSGKGGLTQNGSGRLTLAGANRYAGATAVNNGALIQGAQGAFSAASAYSVGGNGTLQLGGFDTGMAALDNRGGVAFGGSGGTTLAVAGHYVSHHGTLVVNTVLGNDSSKTDLLKIGGDTSGATSVKVINRGGSGAQTVNGIKLIDVSGQSNGTFGLLGDYVTKDGQQAVVAGAYAYTLHKGGTEASDGNWYLRSALRRKGAEPTMVLPRFNPGIPLYQGAIQTMQALNKLPTLQQRLGSRYRNDAAMPPTGLEAGSGMVDGRAVWARVEGGFQRLRPNVASDMTQDITTSLLQLGVDRRLYEGRAGQLIGGITGQYGDASSKISTSNEDGRTHTKGWGLGGTLTWQGNNGFYVDGQAQAMWYENTFRSSTASKKLAEGKHGFGYAFSAETGRRIALNDRWSLTPQAQLMWSSVSFGRFRDVWDTRVSLRNGDSLTGRLGIAADYRHSGQDARGRPASTNVYVIANLYQELLSDTRINVAGLDFGSGNDRTWGGIGVGGNYAWAGDKYALYGEVSANTSLSRFADSYSLKANAGIRMRW